MADDGHSELMMPGDVARLLRVDPKTVARWAKDRRLRCVTLPSGHRRFRRADVRAIMEGEHEAPESA